MDCLTFAIICVILHACLILLVSLEFPFPDLATFVVTVIFYGLIVLYLEILSRIEDLYLLDHYLFTFKRFLSCWYFEKCSWYLWLFSILSISDNSCSISLLFLIATARSSCSSSLVLKHSSALDMIIVDHLNSIHTFCDQAGPHRTHAHAPHRTRARTAPHAPHRTRTTDVCLFAVSVRKASQIIGKIANLTTATIRNVANDVFANY